MQRKDSSLEFERAWCRKACLCLACNGIVNSATVLQGQCFCVCLRDCFRFCAESTSGVFISFSRGTVDHVTMCAGHATDQTTFRLCVEHILQQARSFLGLGQAQMSSTSLFHCAPHASSKMKRSSDDLSSSPRWFEGILQRGVGKIILRMDSQVQTMRAHYCPGVLLHSDSSRAICQSSFSLAPSKVNFRMTSRPTLSLLLCSCDLELL